MLNSEKIYCGVEHADARSLLYATGHLPENIGRKPLIGVVNTFNEIVPGHFHLRGIADAAKQGVLMAGGVPVEFPAIAICDGITMAHKGMIYAAKVIAASAIDALEDPEIIRRAREEFVLRTGGKPYVSPIPADVKPRIP